MKGHLKWHIMGSRRGHYCVQWIPLVATLTLLADILEAKVDGFDEH